MLRALRRLLRPVSSAVVARRLGSGFTGFRHFRRLEGATSEISDGERLEIPLRPLAGRSIVVRCTSHDRWAVRDAFDARYHLPSSAVDLRRARRIWDLGSNIGVTMVHFAVMAPDAQVVGVELDDENAELCRLNTANWRDRCSVIHAAVWSEDGQIDYVRRPTRPQAHNVAGESHREGNATAPAMSLDTLLVKTGGPVDFVKMDIEGAEGAVLPSGSAWAEAVNAIRVEVHEPYTVARCERDLQALGFATFVDRRHWACVEGVRRRG